MEGLIDASPGLEEKRKALRFVAGQLVKQRPADSSSRSSAARTGSSSRPRRWRRSRRARAAHPDLWQPVSAIADQLTEDGASPRPTSALEQATSASRWSRRSGSTAPTSAAARATRWARSRSSRRRARSRPAGRSAASAGRGAAAPRAVRGRRRDVAARARVRPGRQRPRGPAGRGAAGRRRAEGGARGVRATVGARSRERLGLEPLRDLAGDEAAESLARRIVADRPRDSDALIALVRQIAPTGSRSSSRSWIRCRRSSRATPTLTTCAPCCSPTPSVPGSARRLRAGRVQGPPPSSSPGGAPGCSTARGGERGGRRDEGRARRHPDYLWGIRILAEWTAEQARPPRRSPPPSASCASYPRAPARMRRGVPRGCGRRTTPAAARTSSTRSRSTRPTTEAGARLFDTLVARSRHDEAQEPARRQEPHLTPEQIACRSVRLLAARGDRAGALAQLTAELAAGRSPGPPLAPALHAMHQAFGPSVLVEAASGSVSGLHVEAAALLVEVLIERSGAEDARRLVEALGRGPRRPRAPAGRGSTRRAASPATASRPGAPAQLVPEGCRRAHARGARARRRSRRPSGCGSTRRLRLDPTQLEARDLRALLLSQLGRTAEARAACQKLAGRRRRRRRCAHARRGSRRRRDASRRRAR